MNVFNWPDVKEMTTGIHICARRIRKGKCILFLAKQACLQCKDLAPLWIESLVDCVSLKPAVTKLNDAQRVAFLCRRQQKKKQTLVSAERKERTLTMPSSGLR